MTDASSQTEYIITRLTRHHDKQFFSCGSIHLDNYLKVQAGQDAKKNVSVTYVLTQCNSAKVVGYYSIASVGIEVGELPHETIKKLPKYPILPGILLARLAVDKNYQGLKIGGFLLIDVLKRSLNLSKQIGVTAIVVDAKDAKANSFYQHFGFIKFPHNRSKLFLPINTINHLTF